MNFWRAFDIIFALAMAAIVIASLAIPLAQFVATQRTEHRDGR